MLPPTAPSKQQSEAAIPSIHASSQITVDVPPAADGTRPHPIKYMSAPAYPSPLRHHKRAISSTRHVKETLNARSEYSNSQDDGTAEHRINQYLVKQEIGRGSFGAVHLAVDQYGQEYAVKEFSKSRLRKRAQSNLLRRPSARRRRQGALAAGLGFNSPLHRHSSSDENNSLELIKEEIAIMKKLNHPNLVSLIEVLDDPDEDSLYMVMEMCKKGVVMQVGLEERADPYTEEQCRCWFRDMILGIEYLHAQGIIHRDIKPDNCLITEDDVLKIVDFGVSEMFDKQGEMKTAKSAGSPAFMPPELCVPKHGHVSGKAADIWSMGVTLYCLTFGRIPFEKHGMIELYQAIRNDKPEFETPCNGEFRDLLLRLLEKDPEKRITMEELRKHPWVTLGGRDPLLPTSENVAVLVDTTDEEVNAAITKNMDHLVTVVRAVKRFKQLLFRKRPDTLKGILGSDSHIVQPPLSMRPTVKRKAKSQDTDNRRAIEGVLTTEGVHHPIKIDDNDRRVPQTIDELVPDQAGSRVTFDTQTSTNLVTSPTTIEPPPITEGKVVHESSSYRPPISSPIPVHTWSISSTPTTPVGKGHAHDPLEDQLYLNIGTGEDFAPSADAMIVSESPSNVDMDVYETAYQEEVQRILKEKAPQEGKEGAEERRPTLYLTRRVEYVKSIRENDNIFNAGKAVGSELKDDIRTLAKRAKKNVESRGELQKLEGKDSKLSRGLKSILELKDLVDEAREIVREEERKEGRRDPSKDRELKEKEEKRERSRSSTPLSRAAISRSATPVLVELAEK